MSQVISDVHSKKNEPRIYKYIHCDVFSPTPYSGNSLAVFLDRGDLSTKQMLAITQELRHFESIFLHQDGDCISIWVFDLLEELPFAGHPIIGAACTLQRLSGDKGSRRWTFELKSGRTVEVVTHQEDGVYRGCLDQGSPDFLGQIPARKRRVFAEAFNLTINHIADLPMEVISTGLKYLVLPIRDGLSGARIVNPDLEDLLSEVGAEFAYLFDVDRFEGRHWNNDGIVEDVATGSAAGVVGAYALKHGLVAGGQTFTLKQGHFMGRPSEIKVTAFRASNGVSRVEVAGAVAFVGRGEVETP